MPTLGGSVTAAPPLYPDGVTAATTVSRVSTYDVRDYGAKLDGVTDDGPSVNSAINAAWAAGGGIVVIPDAGTNASNGGPSGPTACKVNTTIVLKAGVWLRGLGPTTYLGGTADPLIKTDTAASGKQDRITISDLFLSPTSGRGVVLDDTGVGGGYQLGWPRITVQNVTVADAASDAFYVVLAGILETRFINCVSLRATGYGFNINATDHFLLGCTAAQGGNHGIYLAGGNNKVTGCKAYGNAGAGFTLAGAGRHVLSGCEAQDNAQSGFNIQGNYNTLSGCLADTNKPYGFYIAGKNTITGASSMQGGGGSGYTTLCGFFFDKLTVGCVVDGISNATVKVGGEVASNSVRVESAAPSIQTVAYAASVTPDPFAGETVKITLTGNVAFVTPTQPYKGQRVTFELIQDATGGRTVTWPGNFLSPGAVTTTANTLTTATFEYDGRYWVPRAFLTGIAVPVTLSDTYTRTNATSLATTEDTTASAYTAALGVWGTNGTAATSTTIDAGGMSIATLDPGRPDSIFTITLGGTINGGVTWRYTDANNYYAWLGNSIVKRVAGSSSTIAGGINIAAGSVTIETSGPTHVVKAAGATVLTFVDTFNQTVTKLGFLSQSTAMTFDNLSVA